MTLQAVNPNRYQIFKGVSKKELEKVANDNKTTVLQFAEPLSNSEIENLENIVFYQRPDITLRVFGFYGETCDLSFLRRVPSAKNIYVDCLQNAVGVEVLTTFPSLNKLGIGIYNLDNFDFLNDVSSNLTELYITATASKKPSIEVIRRFPNLRYLYLEGQQKGIEAVQELKNLERIVLRSITTKDVTYLQGLEKLWSVDIKLGGIKDFENLTKLQNLKYLELWQIRGLNDLSFVSQATSLQNLFIQSLKQVTALPVLHNLRNLGRIYLENLKGLTDLNSMEYVPKLRDFIYVLAENQEPDNLLPVLRNPSVENVFCRFGSDKKNNYFDSLAKKFGKKQYSYYEFLYE